MEHRAHHGHHGLTQVHVNSTPLLDKGFATEDGAAMKMTPIILISVMTINQLLSAMLLIAHRENVSICNAIVI